MRFDPIEASKAIKRSFKDYTFDTFRIRDEEFQELYKKELDKTEFAQGPFLDCVDAFKKGASLEQLVDEGILNPLFKDVFKNQPAIFQRSLYKHQEKAIRAVASGHNTVVTTGTGSGKTECFTYPIVNYLLQEKKEGTLCPGVRSLLLYPMNALANDQMKRLRELLKDYPSITFGVYTGETKQSRKEGEDTYFKTFHELPLPNEVLSRDEIQERPPHILVTNYAMLEYLMVRPQDNVLFDGAFSHYWKYIVLDEAHVYSGATGMEVSMLLRRVFYLLKTVNEVQFILTSATLGDVEKDAKIRSFASNLCAGQKFESIIHAERITVAPHAETKDYPSEVIRNLSEAIDVYEQNENQDNKNGIYSVLGRETSPDSHRAVYDYLVSDRLYYQIREALQGNPSTITDIASTIGKAPSEVVDFVRCASFAWKDNAKLLDARYHLFIRTLEGAYITFKPQKTLSLIPREALSFDGIPYKCFKMSVCQFCGSIYLQGIREKDCLDQSKQSNSYFLVFENDNIDEIMHEEMSKGEENGKEDVRNSLFFLDCRTGELTNYRLGKKATVNQILVQECKTDGEDHCLHHCPHCNTTSPKATGIIRGFYLGQDASSAVICDTLYESLPEMVVRKEKREKTIFDNHEEDVVKARRLLSFADSRQHAAFFASYYQYTHDLINNRRRLLLAVHQAERKNLFSVMKKLGDILEIEGSEEPRKQAYLIICTEMKNYSRNNLINTGWLRVHMPTETFPPDEILPIENFTITGGALNALIQAVLSFCLRTCAIEFDSLSLVKEDYLEFNFSGKQPVIMKTSCGMKNSTVDITYIIPPTGMRNTLVEYAMKMGFSLENSTALIEIIFRDLFVAKHILVDCAKKNSSYWLDPKKLTVTMQDEETSFDVYQCQECGRLTTSNYQNICPVHNCDGHLVPFDFKKERNVNSFISKYSLENPIVPLVCKEHTGQLSKEKAREYQEGFLQGFVNVLSCSTTFEMGVDVGELETIFLKNVPPSPANYVQRAGRAGRRVSTAAFALTFCRLASHDLYFFNNPRLMIKGVITPPQFKIDNPKIVDRHIYSVLLSLYWKRHSSVKRIQELFVDDTYHDIEQFLKKGLSPENKKYLEDVVPASLKQTIPEVIHDYINQKLPDAKGAYNHDLKTIQTALEEKSDELLAGHNTALAVKYLQDVKDTLLDQSIIPFLSRRNLLPKYGFPVDTVELCTDATSPLHNSGGNLSLQRDLLQAITDYAPDSEVIADGSIYTSRYILKPYKEDRTWTIRSISECKTCGHLEDLGVSIGIDTVTSGSCSLCHNQTVSTYQMIIPSDGFAIENREREKAKTRKPFHEKRSEYYYIGTKNPEDDDATKKHALKDGHTIDVLSSMNDEILVMNKSFFKVCPSCGYATTKGGNNQEHKNRYGKVCRNKLLKNYRLGHEFMTDVALLHFDFSVGEYEGITLLYTLLEGCSRYYAIERDDIDGCITRTNYLKGDPRGFNIILFDAVPGGAGNVKRIYDSSETEFKEFLSTSLSVVANCTCGDHGDGNAVCYSCLCNYHNQFYHDIMKRKYAIDILNKLL